MTIFTRSKSFRAVRLAAGLALSAVVVLGLSNGTAWADGHDHHGGHFDHGRGGWGGGDHRGWGGGGWGDDDRGGWGHPGWGGGGYYAAPPVVYSSPVYYPPPPVVYGPSIGLNLGIF